MATPSVSPKHDRLLLVDDEAELLRSYSRALRQAGFEVETAVDGETAVEVFRRGDFAAVVSDITMPGISGVQLLRAIREHDLDVPVILVTGAPSVESAIQALSYGALRYLVKPVPIDHLTEVINTAMNLRRMASMKRKAFQLLGENERQVGDRAGLEVKFESAIEKLFMVYQPIVRWSDKSVLGYEALVRSAEPAMPHPGALFDAAERLDRLYDLTRAIRRVTPAPFADPAVAGAKLFLNLHVRDLNDDTLYDATSTLSGMADRVVLEVTERSSLSEVRDPRSMVARLREMGFKIAIDDLGAGYAGLSSFATLEPDVVKLDMALVRGIHLSPTKQKLVRSMTQLCADMGMTVVAEGVETVEERDVLVGLGCDLFQGFLFARPERPFARVTW